MLRSLAAAGLVLLLALTAVGDDLPPGVVNTQDPADVSLSPEETLRLITVPKGFEVTLFAGEPDIRRPLAFDFDNRGRLWVVENYAHPEWDPQRRVDRVVILEDADGDGQFDRRTIFWDQGRFLTGIAYGFGGIFLCDGPELIFLADADRDDRPDGRPEVLLDGWSLENLNNLPNHLTWAPDGWLWGCVGVGSLSQVGRPGATPNQREAISRGIWRFHPVQRRFEVLAHGCVNPWGVDFDLHGDAFNTNTVTAHLWHVVPGAYFERRRRESDNPFAYGRIQSIADHLHWGGGHWASSRGGEGKHHAAGGGHAHTSAMIYLADNWPEPYRGGFFTGNLHGNRINHDRLNPSGSTYVGTHADDLLTCNDSWFRPLELKYGPAGAVYVSDWHDTGECHDNDGSHRTSGRIYRIAYGRPRLEPFDLSTLPDAGLVDLLVHPNQWFVRRAQRLLQERVQRQPLADDAVAALEQLLLDPQETVRLRGVWTMSAVGRLTKDRLLPLLDDPGEHVRWWAVRMLADHGYSATLRLVALARDENSPRVRLELASAAGRLAQTDPSAATALLDALANCDDVHNDRAASLFIWYALEPFVAELGLAAYDVAGATPRLVRYVTRRLLDEDPGAGPHILDYAADEPPVVQQSILEGFADAIQNGVFTASVFDQRTLIPEVRQLTTPGNRSAATRLLIALGDERSLDDLRAIVLEDGDPDRRLESLETLLSLRHDLSAELLQQVIDNSEGALQLAAIRGLERVPATETFVWLLDHAHDFSEEARRVAVEVMTTDRSAAGRVLAALEAGQLDRADVSAYAQRQLRSYSAPEIRRQVERLLGPEVAGAKAEMLARYRALLTSGFLQSADLPRGRELFAARCATCHRLFGEGGNLGPDLTGSQRGDLDYVLRNLLDPSALVDNDYRLTTVVTEEGRLYSGFLAAQDDHELTLKTVQGPVTFPTEAIETIETSGQSMMPDGLLRTFSDEELRDLVAYLARGADETAPPVRTTGSVATE